MGTHTSTKGPGVPADDECPDPEALLGTADRKVDVEPSGFFENPHRHSKRDPPSQEDVSRSPAEAIEEEDCCQQKPLEARNQEGACAKAGQALESVATPGTGSR
ncbi:hypothetical protein NDU88_004043 [Pleurodeles waltl]|uniref:Uncharacterized protein n=1 Tax=Pleurodeles waltl TaxID=8319 RepID=A0AAV7VHI7_PLEWA|nr:hypothetical protein NDU88_004043 [Pleurodeles waltl]